MTHVNITVLKKQIEFLKYFNHDYPTEWYYANPEKTKAIYMKEHAKYLEIESQKQAKFIKQLVETK